MTGKEYHTNRKRVREALARAECGILAIREAGDYAARRANRRLACGLFLRAAALLDADLAILDAGLEQDLSDGPGEDWQKAS